MRILYLSNVLGIHDHRFLSSLVRNGYETYLLTFKEVVPNDIYEISGLTVIHRPLFHRSGLAKGRQGKGAQPKKSMGVRFYCMARRVVGRLQDKFHANIMENLAVLLVPWRVYQTKKAIKELHPDVLHTVWIPAAGLIGALSHFHPVLLMTLVSDVLIQPRKSISWRQITKFVLRSVDMINCDSGAVKKEIIAQGEFPQDKIVVFPWGVDLDVFHPDPELREKTRESLGWLNKKIVIMNRRFAPVYGVEYFLRALPEVAKEAPDTRVLLIGSGPLELSLWKIVKELGLENMVRFQGQVVNKVVPAYLNAADLYVSSPLSDGTSVALLEAMACGLPVVVTDIPSILEWVENGINGVVCPKRDPTSLAKAIITLLQNDQMATEMGGENLKIAKRRANWDESFKLLEEMYERLTMSGNGG